MEPEDQPPKPTFFSDNPKLKVTDEEFFSFIMKPEIHKLLYERYIFNKLPTLSPKKQEDLKLQLGHEALFDIHITCFPGFLRFVRKQVRKTKWYQTHVKELGYLIAIDLLYGKKATIKKTKETPKEDLKNSTLIYERVTNRTRQRLFHQYPELLSKSLREVMNELEDVREQPYNTTFTEPPIGQMDPKYLASIPITLDRYDIGFMQLKQLMMPLHSNYRMVEPYDTEELIQFHNYIKTSINELQQFGEPEKKNQWIKNHLLEGTTLTEHLYQTIMLAVLGRWFRKKKPSARLELLEGKHPLQYIKKDAHDAVKYTKEWMQDPISIFDTINRGVEGLNQMRRAEPSIWLYKECLNQLELELEDIGLYYHNIAIQYRSMGKPRSFKINLQKALKVWEANNRQYDIAVTWAFLAHAHYMLNENEKSKKAKEKAMTMLCHLEDTDYRLSWGYIHMADNAYAVRDIKWEIEALSKGLDYAARYPDESFFNYYNGRLLAINQGKNPLKLEKMGLLIRPPRTPWIKIGSSFHPVLPSKDTPTA